MSRNDYALEHIERDKVNETLDRINKNSKLLDEVVDELVSKYCKDLDNLMIEAKAVIEDKDAPITNKELDSFIMRLSTTLYFTGEAQETLGIREDVAKAVEREVYNKAHKEASGTVSDKDVTAQIASQQEFITLTAISRAYKKIKSRMECGMEILSSFKKVISRRIAELDLNERGKDDLS